MKLIFLDIDGVLNSTQSAYFYNRQHKRISMESRLCPIAMSNLAYILETYPEAYIVVSSSWRKSRTVKQLGKILADYDSIQASRIIDKTPLNLELGSEVRGRQIKAWFTENPGLSSKVTHFVIFDDDGDMEDYVGTPNFIQTSSRNGLTWTEVEQTLKFFGDYNLSFHQLIKGNKYKIFSQPATSIFEFDGSGLFYMENNIKKETFSMDIKKESFSLLTNK